jgi:hypothetical protein
MAKIKTVIRSMPQVAKAVPEYRGPTVETVAKVERGSGRDKGDKEAMERMQTIPQMRGRVAAEEMAESLGRAAKGEQEGAALLWQTHHKINQAARGEGR